MDKPQVDAIEGIPAAIAIEQTNPLRTPRSTVGTMTELNGHLKLLYARAAKLFCRGCGKPVVQDTPETIYRTLSELPERRLVITFPVGIPSNFTEKEILQLLERQGYTRIHERTKDRLEVVQDRLSIGSAGRTRVMEALESALKLDQGKVNVWGEDTKPLRVSTPLHCPGCAITYSAP